MDIPPPWHSAHPSSSTPCGSSQPSQGKATPTFVLLIPYSKQDLLLSCIPRHHQSTLCISLHNPHFCVIQASVECCSLCPSSAMTLFSCGVDTMLIKLVGHWCSDTLLHTCPVLPHHVRTVQTHAGWWQSPALSGNHHHAPTQPIPICELMGCQDHYSSPGMAL